jgi:xylan 1,4-beta-xylosidase
MMIRIRIPVLAILLPAALPSGLSAPSRVIEADLQRTQGTMNRMYNFCVGAGRANEGLRADWQEQLRKVHAECGFRYVRFHGIFCDDMGVYSEDRNGHPIYNWQYVDRLYDFIESIGMRPFVELGFMPGALASGDQTIFWYRANVTPPKSYEKWQAFIAAFVRHVTERYGRDEVKTWYFEVWNEPNLDGFWFVSSGGGKRYAGADRARAEYFRLYEASARAIKSVDSEYRVGGPATAGEGWIGELISWCAQTKAPLDFVCTHSYATTSGFLDENGDAGTIFSPDPDAITSGVRRVRSEMDKSACARDELHYTEWSSSYTPFDPIHDSYHSASFILDKIRNIGGAATSMSYWTFTDIFEEAGPRATPFHGGFGLLNYEDLPKPSFFAYQFLERLGRLELQCADPEAYVCRDEAGGIQALFWDYSIARPEPPVNDQVYYAGDHPPRSKGVVKLALSHVARGSYRLRATKVGYRSNDVQSAWHDLGSPSQLSRAQVAFLRNACSGDPCINTLTDIGADGQFTKEFDMRENDAWIIEFLRL